MRVDIKKNGEKKRSGKEKTLVVFWSYFLHRRNCAQGTTLAATIGSHGQLNGHRRWPKVHDTETTRAKVAMDNPSSFCTKSVHLLQVF